MGVPLYPISQTASAYKIPKAGSDGKIASGFIPDLSGAIITSGLLALARGGTNADLSATGAATHFLRQTSAGAAITVGAISAADLTAALTTPPAIGGTTPAAGKFTSLIVDDPADTTTLTLTQTYIEHLVPGAYANRISFSGQSITLLPHLGGTGAAAIADAVWDEAISGHATTGTTGATLAAIQTRTDYISSGNVSAINPWDARTRTLYITEFDGYTTRGILIEGITVEGIADLTTLTNFTFGFVRANLIVAATSDTMSIDAGDVTADSITLKPTSAFSARMTNMGGRPFKIRALKGSDPVTVLYGTLNISPKLLP